jgi:anaerobic ribonucleoside-triphosphate reductase activating protein
MAARTAKIQINKAHYPVTVLGPGRRIGIWLQGCSIGCKGCVSQDTWPADPARAMPVAALLDWCRQTAGREFDGITLSGGEPFDQPAALRALLLGLHAWRRQSGNDFDILCYSGYPLATLKQKHAALLELLDAVIPEPYVDGLPLGKAWCGSANQSLVPLNERGRRRYAAQPDAAAPEPAKRMQLAVEGGRIWMIGIPDRGDMAQLESLCQSRGLSLDQVSWRR